MDIYIIEVIEDLNKKFTDNQYNCLILPCHRCRVYSSTLMIVYYILKYSIINSHLYGKKEIVYN